MPLSYILCTPCNLCFGNGHPPVLHTWRVSTQKKNESKKSQQMKKGSVVKNQSKCVTIIGLHACSTGPGARENAVTHWNVHPAKAMIEKWSAACLKHFLGKKFSTLCHNNPSSCLDALSVMYTTVIDSPTPMHIDCR